MIFMTEKKLLNKLKELKKKKKKNSSVSWGI